MSTIHEETNNTGDPELNFETRISDAAPVTDNEQKDAGLLDNAQPDPRSGDITDAEGEDIEQRAQGGVKKSEAMAMAWSAIGLNVAYAGVAFLSMVVSLEGNTTGNLLVIATSSFNSHAQAATVTVVAQAVNAVAKAPIAKIGDAIGRLEAFFLSMAFWCIGFLIFASGKNITTLAGGQFFQSFGSTGNQILLQVFIADTSDLLNRALWSTLPDIPFLFTVWLGPLLADTFTKKNWRLGYYIWAPIIPFSFLPLGISMFINQKKAVKKGLIEPSTWRSKFQRENLTKMLRDMDPVGIFLLVAGLSLLLVPITLAASVTSATLSSSGWKSPAILVPIVLGCLCLFAFPFWETKASSVPFPLVPLHLFKNRTVTCGCILGFFYFMAFYLSVQPFFATYLQVVHFQSITGAGRIVSIFSFSCTISALITSQLIKASARYKCFIIFGTLLYTLGYGLMIKYRVENSSVGSIIANQILIGVGGGLINVPVQLGMQASVPHQNVAAVTAMFLVSIEVGGAVGAAISGALWSGRLTPNLIKYLPADKAELAPLIAGSYLEGLIFEKGSPERIAINRAYDDTLHTMLIAAICMTIPLLPLACVMRNIHLDEVNQHVKGRVIGGVVDATGAKVADGNKWTRWTEHTYWKGTTMLWDYINFWDRPYQNWKNRRAAKRRAGSIFEIQPAVPNNLSPGDSPTEKPVDEGREVVN